ncbi:type VI secretion system-associated protein [Rodentibacter ratti]|uniref:Type VI secretion system-associated protein n=1 Tax=Rodentibacter ratti TaxID=1906745 RepID=A0A1V3KW58_9PAST|nr:type VI secretion system baseplate subunit TssK [Rodentibacter ratti]OOF81944.1 type VI secretion system-associated protein [Rodentibacter ratti]
MAKRNRVIWGEGTFVRPQHFQQQQRHLDYLLSNQILSSAVYNYGLQSLEIDQELLNLGRISVLSAKGYLSDGTYFDVPSQDAYPNVLEIKANDNVQGQHVYLALPTLTYTINEIQSEYQKNNHIVRYKEVHEDIRDLHTPNGDSAVIFLAQLAPRLMLAQDDKSAYTYIPIARIKERLETGRIVLDEKFIPTCMTISASSVLKDFVAEIENTLEQRSETLASRIGSPGQRGVAEVSEFLMLQLLNRKLPLYRHFHIHPYIHPEIFYRELVQLLGELMAFTDASRIVKPFVSYDHMDLTRSFQNLCSEIRIALSTVLTPKAVSIQLSLEHHGIRVASINDQNLLDNATFILAVSARMPAESLIHKFVHQSKVSSQYKIQQLVSVQLPGVGLIPLGAAPRQLPYHAGYTYFQLDTTSEEWNDIKLHRSIAFHISGDFPDLDMHLWAVRN